MLLDTSGLLCALDDREPGHRQACTLLREDERPFVHSYVLAELVALGTTRRLPRGPVLRLASELINDPIIEVIWVDERLHRAALDLLAARPDKAYSLADAVSFVLMRERGLADALTTDRHFEQEGFGRLLAA